MKLSQLVKGLPGHPLHPPLTDATIGAYTFATAAALADVVGLSQHAATAAWWLALIFGLVITSLTALTGLIDWLGIEWGSLLWRTATSHMLSMLTATVFFGLAAIFGHDDYRAGDVSAGSFVLTAVGFGFLTLGGWLGGTVVFVHGMRVLNLVAPKPEKDAAEN